MSTLGFLRSAPLLSVPMLLRAGVLIAPPASSAAPLPDAPWLLWIDLDGTACEEDGTGDAMASEKLPLRPGSREAAV